MHRAQAIDQGQHSVQVNLVKGQYKPWCLNVWGSVVGAEKRNMALISCRGVLTIEMDTHYLNYNTVPQLRNELTQGFY